MKTGRTLQEIGAEILRQSRAKEDYLVNTNSIVMEDWDGKPMLHLRGENGMDLVKPLEIQQTAHRQIGDYLGIPRKYYDRMMDSDVGLLAYNVNRWLQGEPEQRMIRTMDGRARAFLSNRYRRIDNLDIARVTLPIIGEMPEVRYESCQLTDDFLYIKVVNPRLTAEVTPGDVVQAGIIISNSETGQGSVCVQPLVYRLVCMNGMVVNDAKTRRTHLGRASNTEEDFMIYSQETLAADDKAFILKLQDTVRAAINEVQFAQVVDKMRETKGIKLNTANIPSVVKMASANFGITEAESEGVFQHLIQDADYTLFGLANAVTRYSQDVENYDRATKLEEILHDYLQEKLPELADQTLRSPELWEMIRNQILPALRKGIGNYLRGEGKAVLIARLNLPHRIEASVAAQDVTEFHRMILAIADEHLVAIQVLGYALGAIAGVLLAATAL